MRACMFVLVCPLTHDPTNMPTHSSLLACTHGDHTIKVMQWPECNVIHELRGHARTPWSVRFHPTRNDVLASGCLAGRSTKAELRWVGVCVAPL